jgi:hypothetical protein
VPCSRHLKHCKGLFGIAVILAVDQPRATFPFRANFRAPATEHLIHAVPRPYLVVRISPTCTSTLSHPAAEASACRCSSLATEMSIPATLNSAVLFGTATLTAVWSSTSARRVASRDAFPLSLSPGSRIIIPPIIYFLIPRDSTPIVASGTFCHAVARTSAYDVLTPSLIVTVTADVRDARGSPAVFLVCAVPFLVAGAAPVFRAPVSLVEQAAGVASFFSSFLAVLFLRGRLFITLHSPPSCSLGSIVAWMTRGAAGWSALRRGSGLRGLRPPNLSSMALMMEGPSSSIVFF